jgi:ABC 3 transport family
MTSQGPVNPHLGWNIVTDVRQLLEFPFMVNAYRAGTIVAVIAGALGWFMVLRRQAFAGHTLAIVSFPGAAAAILAGVSAVIGYFAAAVGAALVIAAVPRSTGGRAASSESAIIGTVQAFALASGALFVSLYGGFLNGLTGLLFGSFLGISADQVLVLLVVAAAAFAALALIAQALVRRPRLLMLDEPLDSLDLPSQASVAALISRICREQQVTVMLVAHDVNPILPYLDCVGYIAAGSAVCGPPEAVITSQTLTALYRTPIEVLRASDGRLVVVGEPEPPARHADRHADAVGP